VTLGVEGFPIERQWSLVWRSDAPLSAPAQRLISDLREGDRAEVGLGYTPSPLTHPL